MAITNGGAASPLAQTAEVAFVTEAGVEQAVPATKTFTTQLAALAVLGLGLGAPAGCRASCGRCPTRSTALLAAPADLEPIVAALAKVPGVVVSGRGMAYAAALELAIKLKEACYLHAMGLSYADLLHGPIAVVDAADPGDRRRRRLRPDAGRHRRPRPAGHRGGRERVRDRRRSRAGRGVHGRAGRARRCRSGWRPSA